MRMLKARAHCGQCPKVHVHVNITSDDTADSQTTAYMSSHWQLQFPYISYVYTIHHLHCHARSADLITGCAEMTKTMNVHIQYPSDTCTRYTGVSIPFDAYLFSDVTLQ